MRGLGSTRECDGCGRHRRSLTSTRTNDLRQGVCRERAAGTIVGGDSRST